MPHRRDTYRFYRSDAASAVEAGLEMRTALIGFGVDSSHGHERTHLDGMKHVAELLSLYLQTDLTFPDWDLERARPAGGLPQPQRPADAARGRPPGRRR